MSKGHAIRFFWIGTVLLTLAFGAPAYILGKAIDNGVTSLHANVTATVAKLKGVVEQADSTIPKGGRDQGQARCSHGGVREGRYQTRNGSLS
jgi:hypothetical protein